MRLKGIISSIWSVKADIWCTREESMWSSQRWLVIEQPPIKFTGASKSEGRKLACTLSLSPCNSPVWWWWVCHFFRGKKWSKGNTVFWSGNNQSQMPVLKQKLGRHQIHASWLTTHNYEFSGKEWS
jgi:hypothetical protein